MNTQTTNLFATATKVKETAKKTDKKVISSPILGNKVQRYAELKQLRHRGWLVNGCIALLTLCAMLIGLTIILLFLGETSELPILKIATISFLSGVACFLAALLCFLAETLQATKLLKFAEAPPSQTRAS